MKKIRITLVTATIVLFFAGCKEPIKDVSAITYPATGKYGDNILSEQVSSVLTGAEYSMKAIVPEGGSLKIIMKGGMWFYGGNSVNWVVTEYDDDTQRQEFIVALKDGTTADLSIEFDDKVLPAILEKNETSITVEYYENNAGTPTKVNPTCHPSAAIYLIASTLHFVKFICGGLRLFFSFLDWSV